MKKSKNIEMGWIEVIHKNCGKSSVLCKDKDYHNEELVQVEDFKHLDGTPCEYKEWAECGSCGKLITFKIDEHKRLYSESVY